MSIGQRVQPKRPPVLPDARNGHNLQAPRRKAIFPMIGKKFSNGWKNRPVFSNDWKKFSAVFQRLEKIFHPPLCPVCLPSKQTNLFSAFFVSPFVPFVSKNPLSQVVFQVV
ncbi:MAG: hypothetical protein IKQ55_08360 [Kiritimatiellae bacterium]|nr:hypothetical protein [Kiritimatiellia bacterium]